MFKLKEKVQKVQNTLQVDVLLLRKNDFMLKFKALLLKRLILHNFFNTYNFRKQIQVVI